MTLIRTSALLLALTLPTGVAMAQHEPPGLPADNPVSPIKAELAGYLRYAKDKRSAGGIPVRLETNTGTFIAQTWTNSAGHFVFPTVGCGYFVIAVDTTDYRPIRELVEHSYVSTETVLYLEPGEESSPMVSDASVSLRQLQIPAPARKEYEKGLVALSRQKSEESIARLRRAVELYPAFGDAYLQLSLVYMGQGAHGKAQEVLEQALAVNPDNARAHAVLGVALREQKKFSEAVQALEHSLSLEETSWVAHVELGETLTRLAQLEEAWRHAARAHELNPATSSVHLLLYKTLILRSDYPKALAELEEFLELYPNHPLAPRAREKQAALRKTLNLPTS